MRFNDSIALDGRINPRATLSVYTVISFDCLSFLRNLHDNLAAIARRRRGDDVEIALFSCQHDSVALGHACSDLGVDEVAADRRAHPA